MSTGQDRMDQGRSKGPHVPSPLHQSNVPVGQGIHAKGRGRLYPTPPPSSDPNELSLARPSKKDGQTTNRARPYLETAPCDRPYKSIHSTHPNQFHPPSCFGLGLTAKGAEECVGARIRPRGGCSNAGLGTERANHSALKALDECLTTKTRGA